ncbi:hypothetical protein [Micromonospora sp. AKA38]|uniref:hypothetical protein n=1 Tax=Micromonospora sp. AKA38 TaxID=2733861 RepID=UPI0022C28AEC|nr:hypothetical protein [Micromonospora sp. AKA38]GHJ13243.1 hypothetical protein TPA0908_12380 [Micromonospora sp. AKA38]GHJ18151.1 hypothetical protein TPA0908_61460 [Micromonospora sp. AKA38]
MARARRTVIALTALLTAIAGLPAAASAAPARAPGPERWSADLAVAGGDDVNVTWRAGRLRLADPRPTARTRPAAASGPLAEGILLAAPRALDRPATRVRARLAARTGDGGTATAEVRGWRAGGWTEWRDATEALFDQPVTRVQARVVLTAPGTAAEATVTDLTLAADQAAAAATQPTAGRTYRVYATRIGLVGGVTANGHVVGARDHFAALPTRRGLSPRGTGDYTVKVCTTNGSRCEYAPVWDVGPWNTRDDWWNPPTVRENWRDLPQGRPEAQAAYEDGYHGGRDQFGRVVRNPAGLDLADGTFWDGLRLTDNAWVNVTLLWTGGGARAVVGSGPLTLRTGAGTSYASRGLAATHAQVPVQCYLTGERIAGTYRTTTRWYRLVGGTYVSHAYLSAISGGPVPRC